MQEELLKFYPTHSLLKKYVLHYVVWKRPASAAGQAKVFLPNNIAGIGFVLSGNLIINTGKECITAPVSGMRDIYHHARSVETEGLFYNISIRFKPHGLKAFMKVHCSELFNSECVDIEALFGEQRIREIREQLLAAPSDQLKVDILEQFLLSEYLQEDDHLLAALVETINRNPNRTRISQLAVQSGCTERTIHRLFAKHIGIPPKEYVSLMRFRNLVREMGQRSDAFVSVALDSGYFDQSHCIKDFRAFTGMTPTMFIEEQKRVSDFYNL